MYVLNFPGHWNVQTIVIQHFNSEGFQNEKQYLSQNYTFQSLENLCFTLVFLFRFLPLTWKQNAWWVSWRKMGCSRSQAGCREIFQPCHFGGAFQNKNKSRFRSPQNSSSRTPRKLRRLWKLSGTNRKKHKVFLSSLITESFWMTCFCFML